MMVIVKSCRGNGVKYLRSDNLVMPIILVLRDGSVDKADNLSNEVGELYGGFDRRNAKN